MQEKIKISVIIPTYNMLEKIKKSIHSIEKQRYDIGKCEVIVVDNGSTDGTSEYIKRHYPWIKLLHENTHDSYKARNKGVSHSSGTIIAVTDADCILGENWLQIIENNFSNDSCDIITGRFIHGRSFLEKIIALVTSPDFQDNKICLVNNFIGANFAIKTQIIKKYYFPEVGLGGDRLLSWRLHKDGYKVLYQPDLIVYHRPDFSLRGLLKRMVRYGYNTIRIRKIDPTLPGGYLMKVRCLAPFFYAGIRFIIDIKNLFKHKRTLNVNIFDMPFYIGIFIVLRIIYFFGMFQEVLSDDKM